MTNITNGTKCQSCTHNSVCAYTKEMTKFTNIIKDNQDLQSEDIFSPLRITIDCKKYDKIESSFSAYK